MARKRAKQIVNEAFHTIAHGPDAAEIDEIAFMVRRCAAGVVTDLSDVKQAACHTDDELLDLAISSVGEHAASCDRNQVYDQVLQELDEAGCDRRRAYHILARLASEMDSMLLRNDAERKSPPANV